MQSLLPFLETVSNISTELDWLIKDNTLTSAVVSSTADGTDMLYSVFHSQPQPMLFVFCYK